MTNELELQKCTIAAVLEAADQIHGWASDKTAALSPPSLPTPVPLLLPPVPPASLLKVLEPPDLPCSCP